MGARRAVRRYGKKAKIGARKVAGARGKARLVERRIADDVRAGGKKAAAGARRFEAAAAKDLRAVEQKTARELKHLAKDFTLFCDTCGKAMRPGGHVSRMYGGRELRFCSALCSAKYHPDHAAF
jgi:hypothetical protein